MARRAGLRFRAGLGAAAVARRAYLERRHADLGLGAAGRILERELQVVAQVGTAIDAVAAPAALRAEDLAEDVAECVGEAPESFGAAESARTRARAEARRRIDTRVPELIVSGALPGVGQDLVGFLRFLEFIFRAAVVRVAVRMVLHRKLPIGLLDVFVGSVTIDAQYRVVIALRHPVPCVQCKEPRHPAE